MMKIYFSDYFNVKPDVLDKYGAFNVSLITDLPLFVDPFSLFNSKKKTYQRLHEEIIRYLRFLQVKAVGGLFDEGLLRSLYTFSEVKQNWLGFSQEGNKGRGLGPDFARSLNRNLNIVFTDFGREKITEGSHLEKLCLIKNGVGKDNISDFTTNLIKEFLLKYTQTFARKCINEKYRKKISVKKVKFNYKTETWESKIYDLPYFNYDYVLLTPKDILTKEDIWINKNDLLNNYDLIADSVANVQLRSQINNYFLLRLSKYKKPTQKQRKDVLTKVLEKYPQLIEYYIKSKERRGEEAKLLRELRISESDIFYVKQIASFLSEYLLDAGFYNIGTDTLEETRKRVEFLKDVIENKGGHRIFYVNGQPVRRESDLQIMFRLTWCGTISDVSREVNDGRGSVDYKISRGSLDPKQASYFKFQCNRADDFIRTQLSRPSRLAG